MAAKNNDELNRAAQFLPFDAMKGLSEELRFRIERRTMVERRELSEEDSEKISVFLSSLSTGDAVRILFFDSGRYIDIECIVDAVDSLHKTLTIGDKKIRYEDIAELRVL